MTKLELENYLQILVEQAWDNEVHWPEIQAWVENFSGEKYIASEEELYALFALSKFMYFSKKLLRQMLRSLYEEHFKSPLKQRIRRNCLGTKDTKVIKNLYESELASTRFVGVGNPAESGAHLLYYFRQINRLPKDLFVDISGAFVPVFDDKLLRVRYEKKDPAIKRFVFFDDLVGSGVQVEGYLNQLLTNIRQDNKDLDFHFISLFATTKGLGVLSKPELFGQNATCMFELDSTYQAFSADSRYFNNAPSWFNKDELYDICLHYGSKLKSKLPLGYKNGQLMLGFSHNTPDNTLPIFWDEGNTAPWKPAFIRYDKEY